MTPGLEDRTMDMQAVGGIVDFTLAKKINIPKFHIYHVPTKTKIPYDKNSVRADF